MILNGTVSVQDVTTQQTMLFFNVLHIKMSGGRGADRISYNGNTIGASITTAGGADSTTFVMRNSVFRNCNNGISLGSNVGQGNGSGPAKQLIADIRHSVITHNAKYGLHVGNFTPMDLLHIKTVSPVTRLLRLPLGAYFQFVITHDRRHLWQAQEVRKTPGFGS